MNKRNQLHLKNTIENSINDFNLNLDAEIITYLLVNKVDNFNRDKKIYSNEELKKLFTENKKDNYVKFIFNHSVLSNKDICNNKQIPFRELTKFVSAYNISRYFKFNLNFQEKESLDYPTMLGYFSLIKITNAWRALESFFNLIDKFDNSKELRNEICNQIDNNNDIKDICFDLHLEKNSSGESFFFYLDKQNKIFTYKNNPSENNQKVNEKYVCLNTKKTARTFSLYELAKDIRNNFMHSSISASSGSGNPNVTTVVCNLLAEHILDCLNTYSKTFFLNIIDKIEK